MLTACTKDSNFMGGAIVSLKLFSLLAGASAIIFKLTAIEYCRIRSALHTRCNAPSNAMKAVDYILNSSRIFHIILT